MGRDRDTRPGVAHLKRVFLIPTETFVGNQIATLRGYRPVVYCHHRVPNDSYHFEEIHSVEELLPPLRRSLDRISYRVARYLAGGAAALLAERLAASSVSLLHFHYLVDARFFLPLKRVSGLPAIVSAYGYDVSSFPHAMHGLGKRYLQPIFREMDCFIAMSQDMRKDLVGIGCPEEKIVVHYYGTDTDRFACPDRGYPEKAAVEILACATLEPKKAQDRLLQALRMWEQRSPSGHSFRVVLMGDGPLRPRLEALVQEYGWQDRVRLLGHVPHHEARLLEEYRRADIFALPSRTTAEGDKEGIPGTVVEAMAAGLPVVSTYHAGIPEVVTSEKDGLLVDENDLDGLSHALGWLIEDRALRERLGRTAAQTAASRCRLLSRTPELERIYDRLLSGELFSRTGEERRADR